MKELKYSKVLSNGQVATLFVRVDTFRRGNAAYIGFVIGKSIRQNKNWWSGKPNTNSIKSTGKCGLEGMLFALSIIEVLKSSFDCIVISWSDNKRKKAYKRLLDYGFVYGEYTDPWSNKEDVYFWIKQ